MCVLGLLLAHTAAAQVATHPASATAGQRAAGIDGFGATSRGGDGGAVITVTSLADSGPGTLREALATKGPRIIRFAVDGEIVLKSRLRVTDGWLTVDGSAKPRGLTLRNHGIQIVNCSDVVIRNLRIRVTTGGDSGDCILLWGKDGGTAERIVIDHCSLMGATDECVNTWGSVRDATFQWCIVANGRPPHSKAWLSGVGSDRVSIHHCLLADCDDRTPKLEGGLYEFANNVVSGWSNNNAMKVRSGARVNVIGNCFVPGPKSAAQKGCVFIEDPPQGLKLFLRGNISPLTPDATADQWLNVTLNDKTGSHRPAPAEFKADRPFAGSGLAVEELARAAAERVLDSAGAMVRDEEDEAAVKEVRQRLKAMLAVGSKPAK